MAGFVIVRYVELRRGMGWQVWPGRVGFGAVLFGMVWLGRCGDVGLCMVVLGLVMQGKLRLGR